MDVMGDLFLLEEIIYRNFMIDEILVQQESFMGQENRTNRLL